MRKTYLLAGAMLLAFSTAALAGFVQPAPVAIMFSGDGSGTALGDMVTARFADDEVSLIGCGVRTGIGGAASFGFCQATDSAEQMIVCFTEDPDLMRAMAALADFSFISFSWDSDENCTRVGSSTQSFYLPKKLK